VLQHLAQNPEISRDWRWSNQQELQDVIADVIAADRATGRRKNGSDAANGAPSDAQRETPRKLTQAGKPPAESAGGSSLSSDDEDAALKRGDQDEFRRIANERDLARRRGLSRRRR
jgi:hypothetical protein